MSSNDRRRFLGQVLAVGSVALLAGCDRLNGNKTFKEVLASSDKLTDKTFHALTPENALAQDCTTRSKCPDCSSRVAFKHGSFNCVDHPSDSVFVGSEE